ncbi:alginate O-acetyltransferase AlgX-related protein [Hymenobacter persicinus]|uniref:AlgX/AlgJ SGNH hydrolase-like domain-containing protein n=1 Tax=Hymenobacter persicinus TaxID=2025506 RepID=A0A4Q5LCC2_9BACT|nr:hypothetical protein [Hymenobacter persicinus]RYU80070.1 hypothetical protein EWM57_09000 [Hymenobacter persicinus]
MSHPYLKRLLFGGLLALFILPALQAKLAMVTVEPLDGFYDKQSHPDLTWTTLRTNNYQPQLEAYLQDRLGFRNWLIRLRNQLAYSFFHQTKVSTVVVGRDDVLYQPITIDVYLGKDYASDEELDYKVRRLKLVQDSLQAHGTQLLLVIAPSKARVMPKMIPPRYDNIPRGVSNYDGIMQAARKRGLNVLDAAALLVQWQDTARYPMFPRGGTHWSGYATALVADTMFRRVEALTHLDLPDFALQGLTVATEADSLRFTDDDLQLILNRMWEMPPYPMAYPRVVFGPETGKQRADALIIGDSFAQSFYNFYPFYQQLLGPRARYWASNEKIFWPEQTPETHTVSELNLGEQLAGRDIVMIICTEQNLGQLGFGFINQAYRLFRPLTDADKAAIDALAAKMTKEASWDEASQDGELAKHMHEKATNIYDHTHL